MKKAAVIGNPIAHSRSPMIHNYWLKKYGIEGTYEAIKAEDEKDFEKVVARLVDEDYSGFNVTVPFKEKAYDLVDELVHLLYVPGLQTANTVVIQDKKLIGLNTDYYGFTQGFAIQHRENYKDPTGTEGRFDLHTMFEEIKNIVILGAGGAARIIAFGLLHESDLIYNSNCTLTILNRDENRAKDLCSDLKQSMQEIHDHNETVKANERLVINHNSLNGFNQAIKNCDLLINCTTIGMQGGAEIPDFNFENAKSSMIFYDLVYTPLVTPLHIKAAEMGLVTMGGLGMLVNQAVPAFKVFYGAGGLGNGEREIYVPHLSFHVSSLEMARDPELWEMLKKDISKKND